MRHPIDPFKHKYMISRHEQLDVHCNLFDSSFVEYYIEDARKEFDVHFDQKLYEPPQEVLDLQAKIEAEQEAQSNKSKANR